MPNRLVAAFEKALRSAAAVKGSAETVTFRGDELEALIFANPQDNGPGLGGEVLDSTVLVSLRLEDVDLPILDLEEITVRGVTLAVFTPTPAEGRLDLLCGNPASELRD